MRLFTTEYGLVQPIGFKIHMASYFRYLLIAGSSLDMPMISPLFVPPNTMQVLMNLCLAMISRSKGNGFADSHQDIFNRFHGGGKSVLQENTSIYKPLTIFYISS